MMKKIIPIIGLLWLLAAALGACSKDKSYSELLRKEEKAVNWYMSNQRVETQVPADSIFECGPDAPYYRMDPDGYIYMQVLNPGTRDKMARVDQLIYFRYMRTNIIQMYEGLDPKPQGNADNVGTGNTTSFRFQNKTISSSLMFGTGIQLPLLYLGTDCEVNIMIRAYYGFQNESGQCQPYIYNVRYFPAQF